MKVTVFLKFIAFVAIGLCTPSPIYAQHSTNFRFSETAPDNVLRTMENNANSLFAELNRAYDKTGSLNLSQQSLTTEAIGKLQTIWVVSHFYCTRTTMIARVMKFGTGYQVRNVPVFFNDWQDDYRSQHVVIEFDSEGKISDFYCMVPEHEYTEVISNSNDMTDLRHREMIKNFVDHLLDAYNRKDIGFIEKTYSGTDYSNEKDYLKRLKTIFESNTNVNASFSDIEIVQSEVNHDIYGIRLTQHLKSFKYSDNGQLFIVIDLENESYPKIVAWIWQPEKDKHGNKINYTEEESFSIGDFNFYQRKRNIFKQK